MHPYQGRRADAQTGVRACRYLCYVHRNGTVSATLVGLLFASISLRAESDHGDHRRGGPHPLRGFVGLIPNHLIRKEPPLNVRLARLLDS